MIWCLELINTENNECRYREYTRSEKRANDFAKVPRVQFTDSGHGIIPIVTQGTGGKRRLPSVRLMADYVRGSMRTIAKVRRIGAPLL